MRDCCYTTCASFLGANNVNDVVDTPCGQACKQCMDGVKLAHGKDLCEFRLNVPPIFGETPHFFPNLYRQHRNKTSAYNQCVNMCKDTSLPLSCIDNCKMDVSAVVNVLPSVVDRIGKEGYNDVNDNNNDVQQPKRFVFWLSFILSAIFLSIFVAIFLLIIFNGKTTKRRRQS